ncbi:MAG: acyl-ACP thioesterase domain-containing protein [Bacteroidota bacterium]
MALHYEETHRVRAYEVNECRTMRVPALLKVLHEAAMQNVINLGISYWDLKPKGISWILLHQRLDIERLPKLGETITIHTRPSGFERLFNYRDYKVYDTEGQLLLSSASTWLLLHTATRKIAKIPRFILDLDNEMPNSARLNDLPRCQERLPRLSNFVQHVPFQVHWYDLDFNEHANNIAYVRWMFQVLPIDVLRKKHLQTLHISFKAECLLHQQITVKISPTSPNEYLHQIQAKEDGKVLALAKTIWSD